jgi:hypothetical protein
VVAHAGSDRRNIESRPGPEAEVDGHACAHVLVVDHFLELTAEQRSQGHAGGSRIGSAVEPGLVDPGHGSILRPQVPGSAVPSGTSVDKWPRIGSAPGVNVSQLKQDDTPTRLRSRACQGAGDG